MVAGRQVVEQLPGQARHAGHIGQAQHRMVAGADQLVALARPQPQRGMVARMEQLRGAHGPTGVIEEREAEVVIRVRHDAGGDRIDPERAAGSGDTCLSRNAIAHRRRGVAVDRSEVALTVHQRVAHDPVLGQAHQRRIDDLLAVGVVVARGVAGDLGALPVRPPRREVQVVHRDQDPALRGLEAVAHVREGPRDDDRHRVIDVAGLHLVFDIGVDDSRAIVERHVLGPVSSLARPGSSGGGVRPMLVARAPQRHVNSSPAADRGAEEGRPVRRSVDAASRAKRGLRWRRRAAPRGRPALPGTRAGG